MSAEDIPNQLHRNPYLDHNDIAAILTQMQGIPVKVEDSFSTELQIYSPIIRVRSNTYIVGVDVSKTTPRGRWTETMRRKIPLSPNAYPLTHTKFGTISYPYKPKGSTKFGGIGQTDGTYYQTIADHARLNPTLKITVTGFLNLPAISADGIIVKKDLQYELKVISGNKLSWRTYSGGAWRAALEYTFTINTWFEFAVTYDSTVGHKIIINGVEQATDAVTGALNTTTNVLGLFAESAGTNKLPNLSKFAWITMLQNTVDTTWSSDHSNGLLDTKDKTEITTMPFVGDDDPRPDATAGLC
jgi:hypothetical protein